MHFPDFRNPDPHEENSRWSIYEQARENITKEEPSFEEINREIEALRSEKKR